MSQKIYRGLVRSLCALLFSSLPALAEEAFHLNEPGVEANVRYTSYGDFSGVGTSQYRYVIKDREGLARAVGEGIYPNVTGLLKDPVFQKMQYEGKLAGNIWDYVTADDPQVGFYKWASNHEEPAGLKQFYAA